MYKAITVQSPSPEKIPKIASIVVVAIQTRSGITLVQEQQHLKYVNHKIKIKAIKI